MSIKNPYSDFTFHGDQYGGYQTGNIEHDAFSEGVEVTIVAANILSNYHQVQRYLNERWAERKKEINQ